MISWLSGSRNRYTPGSRGAASRAVSSGSQSDHSARSATAAYASRRTSSRTRSPIQVIALRCAQPDRGPGQGGVQPGVAVEPRLRLLELGGELEQQPVRTQATDELDAEGQARARPVERHADRGTSGQVRELGVGHPADVLVDDLVEHPRDRRAASRPASWRPRGRPAGARAGRREGPHGERRLGQRRGEEQVVGLVEAGQGPDVAVDVRQGLEQRAHARPPARAPRPPACRPRSGCRASRAAASRR